jgi:hypothetical protein
VKIVAVHDVARGVRGREHDDGDPAQFLVVLDLGQHSPSVHARKVEIEEDQVRTRRLGVDPLTPKEVKGLDPVGRHVETTHGSDRPQGLLGQVHVGRVVLDQ